MVANKRRTCCPLYSGVRQLRHTQPTHHQPHNGNAWPHAVLRLSSRDKEKEKSQEVSTSITSFSSSSSTLYIFGYLLSVCRLSKHNECNSPPNNKHPCLD